MLAEKYRHPGKFYALSLGIPWILWFSAAALSRIVPGNAAIVLAYSILGIAGLASPMVVALAFFLSDPELRRDGLRRIFNFGKTRSSFYILAATLMLASILAAQGISLLFGRSVSQFAFATRLSFSAGIYPAWFVILIAPILEELAWHSYGTDALRSRFSLITTTIIFSVFWVLWHVPLAFIRGYYQSNVVDSGWIYSLNYAASLFPFMILMNWLYYRTKRNILVAVMFHLSANVFNEIFATHPDSKVIQTALLLLICVPVLVIDRRLFFTKELSEEDWTQP